MSSEPVLVARAILWIHDWERKQSENGGYFVLWGTAFSEETDPAIIDSFNYGEFEGDIKILNDADCVLKAVAIGRAHSTRRGFGWTLSEVDCESLPEPPFLATDVLNVERIFSGIVELAPSPALLEFIDSAGEDVLSWGEHMVRSGSWFGVLGRCEVGTVLRGHLVAFSGDPESHVERLQRVIVVDLGSEDIGTITAVIEGKPLGGTV